MTPLHILNVIDERSIIRTWMSHLALVNFFSLWSVEAHAYVTLRLVLTRGPPKPSISVETFQGLISSVYFVSNMKIKKSIGETFRKITKPKGSELVIKKGVSFNLHVFPTFFSFFKRQMVNFYSIIYLIYICNILENKHLGIMITIKQSETNIPIFSVIPTF